MGQNLYNATLYIWLVAAVILLFRFKVLSAGPLRAAPTRQGFLSLPIVGGVVVVYLFVAITASVIGVATGLLPGPPQVENPATQAALVHPPETASQPAASRPAETRPAVPASRPADEDATADGVPPNYTLAAQLINTAGEVAAIALAVLLCRFLFYQGCRGWGLHFSTVNDGLKFGGLGFLVAYPLVNLTANLTFWFVEQYFHRPLEEHPAFQAVRADPSAFDKILLFFLAAGVVPVVEEIFFRGLLQTSLIQYGWGFVIPQLDAKLRRPNYRPPVYQRWAAIAITSVIFCLMHQSDHFLILFVLSAAMGYVYERTGNLWSAITLHALFNSTSLLPELIQSLRG